MAALKSYTVYIILLTIALIWNYRAMPSNADSECEFDSQRTYNESCPNGATGLRLCEPGQKKINKSCIRADEDTTNICDPCEDKYFQVNFSRCIKCHECSECGTNERVDILCTKRSNTICKPIGTTTLTDSQGSTTKTPSRVQVSTRDSQTDESTVVMTTCEDCKTTQSDDKTMKTAIATESEAITPTEIKGSGNRAPENGLSQGGMITIVVICVIVILGLVVMVGCFLRKSKKVNCPLWNNNQQPNAGDGGVPPNNGPQGDPLLPRNGDAAARLEAND
ncbi:uncharacterized protein [Diadema setosum]|uniref:uncharacterized protein n=1 Tax=Diadema setosum TaxID=31175 RepID=UPI003B3ACB01